VLVEPAEHTVLERPAFLFSREGHPVDTAPSCGYHAAIPPEPPAGKQQRRITVDKWECLLCGYVYDPELGDPTQDIEPGTAFEDLPDDWTCPDCGAGKEDFERLEE
jgi:rubredoxin